MVHNTDNTPPRGVRKLALKTGSKAWGFRHPQSLQYSLLIEFRIEQFPVFVLPTVLSSIQFIFTQGDRIIGGELLTVEKLARFMTVKMAAG